MHPSQGASIADISKWISITEQTYYRWRKEYSGMRIEQASQLKTLGKENARLKRPVARAHF
jgi:putative transposase